MQFMLLIYGSGVARNRGEISCGIEEKCRAGARRNCRGVGVSGVPHRVS
jgi:hypothetical protein